MLAVQIAGSVINLNQPQHYFHWSIFTVSVANLIIIATMIMVFGLALILPFPKSRQFKQPDAETEGANYLGSQGDSKMWTARLRRLWLKVLPPGKLLPDRQPAYVSSWIYVFGVATLAALGVVVVSGIVLAFGGVNWWHESPLGHFINSIHLWSVELFMAFMVIHLWGKFWMAAWRGRRALTWMTGVVAFAVSILACFTGYLSQQNFDSQWIATNGKDAINSVGLGSFFNLLNFGQMLTWHIVIIPLILVVIVGAHILMVRARGVSRPIERARGHEARRVRKLAEAAEWRGPTRRYDILKEGTIATGLVLVLVIVLAGLLSSPDKPPVTVQSWAKIAPADFVATAASELAGTSETAKYGPPYNNGTSNVQKLGLSWQMLGGVRQPIDTARTFVLGPLSKNASTNPKLASAIAAYSSASAKQRSSWDQAYANAVTNATFKSYALVGAES